MNKQEFQRELILYTRKRLNETEYATKDPSIQRAYQMGVLMGLLYDLADADSYNYKRILYTLYPELKPKNNK